MWTKKWQKPHSHTVAFPSTVQRLRLKKKHKNKLHKYFLASLFLQPCVLVSCGVVFCKSVFVLCSAGFGAVPCPPEFQTYVLTWAASRLASWLMWHPSSKGQKGHLVPKSRSSQRPPSLAPLLVTEGNRGPFMKTWGGMSVRFCLNNSCSEVKDIKRGSLHVCAYLRASSCVCTVCVCASVCVYIGVKWPEQSWGCQADSVWGEQHLLSRPPPSPLLSSNGATVWAAARPLRSGSIWTAVCLWQNPSSHTASGLICWWFQSPKQPADTERGISED